MTMITCAETYSMPEGDISALERNQGGIGRHKCVICAYNHGLEDGQLNESLSNAIKFEDCKHGSHAPTNRIKNIHENQVQKEGRHKCLICAYELGFNKSVGRVKIGVINNKRPQGNLTEQKIKKSNENPNKRDFIEEQRYKTTLGLMGEKLVVKYLEENGHTVKHVSLENDSAGYDILATKNGNQEFIEVKTTTQGFNLDFFISKNELEFMGNNRDNYFIYRVYGYNFKTNSAEFYILSAIEFDSGYTTDCVSYKVKKNV